MKTKITPDLQTTGDHDNEALRQLANALRVILCEYDLNLREEYKGSYLDTAVLEAKAALAQADAGRIAAYRLKADEEAAPYFAAAKT